MSPDQPRTVLDLTSIAAHKDDEFKYGYSVFVRDHHVFNFLVKHLQMPLQAVYTKKGEPIHVRLDKIADNVTKEMVWGQQTMILLFNDGKVVMMTNSEWASIHACVD